ncbi:MAG: 5'-nucleotidase, lipoprotein e(P4) family [Pyrinomonadaceae bacterium]
MKPKNFILSASLVIVSVVTTYFVSNSTVITNAQQTAPAVDNEYQVAAILFQQKAAEYRALTYQAFNIAKMQLDADFDKKSLKKLPKAERKKPRAVVVDVDETVLDNSPHQAFLVKQHLPFMMDSWLKWGEMRRAKPIPGAVDFLNYAHQKGVRVFYVSNRLDRQKPETIDNLKATGFPDVSEETVMLLTDKSTKEPRRQKITETCRVVILMGDNLNDLSEAFEGKSVEGRFAEVDRVKDMWGHKFIVLPNVMYGAWESAIYGPQRLTEEQKKQMRIEALESFSD